MVGRAITVLGELGATVEEVSLPLSAMAGPISGTLLAVEPANNHARWVHENINDYGHDDRILLLTGSVMPARYYNKAQKIRELIRRTGDWTPWCITTPWCSQLPGGEHSPWRTIHPVPARRPPRGCLTCSRACSTWPAALLCPYPAAFDDRGMPVGLQIGGKPFSEETLFRIGHAYEQATDWHTGGPQRLPDLRIVRESGRRSDCPHKSKEGRRCDPAPPLTFKRPSVRATSHHDGS